MTRNLVTGYQRDQQGVYIEKDPGSELTYSMDWSDWLLANDEINSVSYSITSPTPTDPNDMDILDSGVVVGTTTYAKIAKGVANKIYTINVTITTTGELTEERHFRIKVKHRSI